MAAPVRYGIVGSGMMGVEHILNIQALGASRGRSSLPLRTPTRLLWTPPSRPSASRGRAGVRVRSQYAIVQYLVVAGVLHDVTAL